MSLVIDHLYTLVADRARVAATLHGWGFDLTEAGVHSGRGTSNHLVIFPGPYWELLAVDAAMPVNRHLQAHLASGAGLLGCALATADIEADSAGSRERGIAVGEVQDVSRPVRVGDQDHVARFRVAQIDMTASFDGSFFFCQHLTPELVWPQPLPVHPNGSIEIAALLVVGPDPGATAEDVARLLGSYVDRSDGYVVRAAALALHCISPEQFAGAYPDAPWQFGPRARFAGITLRAPGIAACAQALGDAALSVPGKAACVSAHHPSLGRMIMTWRDY